MNICCVTVTYGNRAHLLEQVVNAIAGMDIKKVIIVDNGSTESSSSRIYGLKERYPGKITIIRLKENYGSAKGFKVGLQEALNLDCDFVYS